MTTLNLWGEPAYCTTLETSMAVMRELNRIRFEQLAVDWFEKQAPAVRAELERRGVKFPKEGGA